MTPALSERCSNQLSYGPLYTKTSEKKRQTRKPDSNPDLVVCVHRIHFVVTFGLTEGGDPAALSSTATLLRLHSPYQSYLRKRPLLRVSLPALGIPSSDSVTGGVYKARERIHRAVLMRDY